MNEVELTNIQRNSKLKCLSDEINGEGVKYLINVIEQRLAAAMASAATSVSELDIRHAQGEFKLAQSILSLVEEARDFYRGTP